MAKCSFLAIFPRKPCWCHVCFDFHVDLSSFAKLRVILVAFGGCFVAGGLFFFFGGGQAAKLKEYQLDFHLDQSCNCLSCLVS